MILAICTVGKLLLGSLKEEGRHRWYMTRMWGNDIFTDIITSGTLWK